jgi:preprotein translocase subunit SecG
MGVIGIILLVAFVIVCILLVAIVLLQDDEGGGLGGLLGGPASTTFGSQSGNVLTKTTYVLVTLFFLTSFGLAIINKAPTVKSLDAAVEQTEEATENEFWKESAPAEMKADDATVETTEVVTE